MRNPVIPFPKRKQPTRLKFDLEFVDDIHHVEYDPSNGIFYVWTESDEERIIEEFDDMESLLDNFIDSLVIPTLEAEFSNKGWELAVDTWELTPPE